MEQIIKEKINTNTDFKINGISGNLYGFQKTTVAWLLNNQGRGLVSLDLGLGKTICSLAYVTHTKKEKTLVICPVSMKYTWKNEIEKWTKLKTLIIDSKSDVTLEDYQQYDIFVINFDILKKFFTFLTSVKFDCLIVDESTYCKNPKSIRAKATCLIAKRIESVILLSGSPLLNRVVELYTSLNILDPNTWNNYYSFVKRYCNAYQSKWGLDVSGASNIPELKEKISKYIIRKKKEDVLTELPDKKFINISIKLDSETQQKYQLLENSFIEYLKEIKNKSKREIQKALLAETLVKLNELRMLTSIGKINSTKEIIKDIINAGEKVVVFSSFNNPLKELQMNFEDESVIIMGNTSGEDRQKAIETFQNDPNKKIFFGGMLSANMGITLTAGSVVVFLDYDWCPENMRQAYSRIDRIGQKAKSISIYQMVAIDTIDQKMKKILDHKQRIIDQLIEGRATNVVEENKIINEVLKTYN